jgi:hypothetical protein
MLMTKERRAPIGTLRGWAISVLQEPARSANARSTAGCKIAPSDARASRGSDWVFTSLLDRQGPWRHFNRGIDTCGNPLHLLDAAGAIWITSGSLSSGMRQAGLILNRDAWRRRLSCELPKRIGTETGTTR